MNLLLTEREIYKYKDVLFLASFRIYVVLVRNAISGCGKYETVVSFQAMSGLRPSPQSFLTGVTGTTM